MDSIIKSYIFLFAHSLLCIWMYADTMLWRFRCIKTPRVFVSTTPCPKRMRDPLLHPLPLHPHRCSHTRNPMASPLLLPPTLPFLVVLVILPVVRLIHLITQITILRLCLSLTLLAACIQLHLMGLPPPTRRSITPSSKTVNSTRF